MHDYDYVIIGSGFGGAVSALRLSEKGYKVLVIEKGKWYKAPGDFPRTNWNLKKWMWLPSLGFTGILKLTFFRHVNVLSGVGVGGGSLVYANTLPVPKAEFFNSGHWEGLADWEEELKPFYAEARRMLGAVPNPNHSPSDAAMERLAGAIGQQGDYAKTEVGVFFGTPDKTVPDPYFDGEGPERAGCNFCGGCMTGCRHNAKNTLDKNYLYLAQQHGCEILAEKKVIDVLPLSDDGSEGYEVHFEDSLRLIKRKGSIRTRGVIFAGGVLGTLSLLLRLKRASLPHLSDELGSGVRTNSESMMAVTTFDDIDFAQGVSIGSIINIDQSRHLEPVIHGRGSGFWRVFLGPMAEGRYTLTRLFRLVKDLFLHPVANFKVLFTREWARRSMVLLYMESIDSTLRFSRNWFGRLSTSLTSGPAPTAFNPVAQKLAKKTAAIVNGKPMAITLETLFGIPSTAHILGGACMGRDAASGVIDKDNRVFNYENMLVCDGSMISANPGVNPSLSITAITERAMSKIPLKEEMVIEGSELTEKT